MHRDRALATVIVVALSSACGSSTAPARRAEEAGPAPVAKGVAEPSVQRTEAIRWVSTGTRRGAYICVRFVAGDLRCATLQSTTPGFTLEPLSPVIEGEGVMGGGCIADRRTVHCNVFDDEPKSYEFPFTPAQLVPWAAARVRQPDGQVRLGPRRLCARGDDGKVVCKELDDAGRTFTLFEASAEISGDGQDLLSRRADGTVECVGSTICAMAALAEQRLGAASPRTMEDLAASWPGALDKPRPIETPHVISVPRALHLRSVNPACVQLDDATLACWDYLEGPRRITTHAPASWVSWGAQQCTLEGDDVQCRPHAGAAPAPQTFHVEGAERLLNADGRLCVLSRTRSLTCFSAPGSLWGEHEATLAL